MGLFALIYIPLMIGVAFLLHLIDWNSSQGVDVGCLAGASIATATAFSKNHGRAFTGAEYWTVLGGSLVVDFIWQSVPFTLALLSEKISGPAFIFTLAFLAVLHGLLLAFIYSSRMMARYVPKTKP